MELKNWLKAAWWVILVIVITFFVAERYNSIINGNATPVDVVILLIWIAILFAPLFSEVSIFGVTLKKEIDALRSDLKEQITSLRTDVQNSINVRQEFNPNIIFGTPPPDSQLRSLSKNSEKVLKEMQKAEGIHLSQTPKLQEIEIPEYNKLLMFTRYEIENELMRIYENYAHPEQLPYSERVNTVPYILSYLVDNGLLASRLSKVVQQVYSICSVGVHARKVSSQQVNFVRDVAPGLLATLKAIQ